MYVSWKFKKVLFEMMKGEKREGQEEHGKGGAKQCLTKNIIWQ